MKRIISFLFFVCVALSALNSQNTSLWQRNTKLRAKHSDSIVIRKNFPNGKIHWILSFKKNDWQLSHDWDIWIDSLLSIRTIWPSYTLNGVQSLFSINGDLRMKEVYKEGHLISSDNYLKKMIDYHWIESPRFIVDEDSLYRIINSNIFYPPSAAESSVQGTVYVGCLVNITGHFSEFKVLQSLDRDFDEIAVNAIKKIPFYLPAMIDGEPIESIVIFPVRFRLE